MCVIICIPKGETISKKELKKAWKRNSDGAGYAIKTSTDEILYCRGFMKFNNYWNAIKYKIGREDLILHLRISTSAEVNQIQTHPYEVGKKQRLKGLTKNPVVCMNGVINGQYEYKGYNDTMSYIQDHLETFMLFKEAQSQDLIEIIKEATGAKWAILTTKGILMSSGFTKDNGIYYSNLQHRPAQTKIIKTYCTTHKPHKPEDYLYPKVWEEVKTDPELIEDIQHFIDSENNYLVNYLYWCTTKQEVQELIYLDCF